MRSGCGLGVVCGVVECVVGCGLGVVWGVVWVWSGCGLVSGLECGLGYGMVWSGRDL